MASDSPLGDFPVTRRELLRQCGMGFASVGLTELLAAQGLLAEAPPAATDAAQPSGPLAPVPPHFRARAKRVIHLFMNGGPSHVDTFDPKPALDRYAGQRLPTPNLPTERSTGAAFPSPFRFRKYGHSGLEVSELFPHVASCIDDICIIRSMQADVPNHPPSLLLMNCGDSRQIRPSLGSWVTYGLGTENQNLPAFITMCPRGYPVRAGDNWRSAFLPSVCQGTYIDTNYSRLEDLIAYIRSPAVSRPQQRQQLDLLRQLNSRHLERRQNDSHLEARIQSFELAYGMQHDAEDAFDLSREPRHIRALYGADVEGRGGLQGRQLLIARRLLERGVRFVQVWHAFGQPWDNHDDLEIGHRRLAGECDQAIGALLRDLKQRGLLEDTLVIWGGEFGRTPTVELPTPGFNTRGHTGRDHNHYGFSMWLAGGGVKGGHVHGATDEFGFRAIEDPVHVHDLHATVLHLLGLDHERLTYRHAGREYRLTDGHGQVVRGVIA